MDITVRGKHTKVPKKLQVFATEKMEHLEKFLSTISSIDVEIYEDGKPRKGAANQVVHVTVITPVHVFRAKATSVEPHAGIEQVFDKLQRQIKEFKRKRSGKPAHAKPAQAKLSQAMPSERKSIAKEASS